MKEDFRKLNKAIIGGAMLSQSTNLLAHKGNPAALSSDLEGMVGIGIGGAISSAALEMGYRKRAIRTAKYQKKRR